jgi:hypothetical protein
VLSSGASKLSALLESALSSFRFASAKRLQDCGVSVRQLALALRFVALFRYLGRS